MSTNPIYFSCPLAEPGEALKMIRTLERIDESTQCLPGVLKRITELEHTRDLQEGWANSRQATKKYLTYLTIAFIGFGLTIWGLVSRNSDKLKTSVESIRGEAVYASDRALAVQDRIDIADEKAEAAALERANLAETAKQNVARIRAMRSTMAKNSAAIAAIPPPAAPAPPAKKKWRLLP